MADQLTKLRPDRDLQCYFQQPTAVAALSGTSAPGFTVSGSWRQQFDWAVVEWNRDNVFEYPALRNLPDGDLSGIKLSYQETRTNCIPIDSTSYDSLGWSYLRVWEESGGSENFHWVPLLPCATAVSGGDTQATAQFVLEGSPTAGDYVELAWLDQHSNYLVTAADSPETIVAGLAGFVNGLVDGGVTAAADGTTLTLTYTGAAGANGNRVGIYAGVSGAGTEAWSPAWQMFSGGASAATWQVNLDFSNLADSTGAKVNTTNVRKMRWTWAADWQFQDFGRSEFSILVSNWQVSGSNLSYSVAGPGSWRVEDNSGTAGPGSGAGVAYTGDWDQEPGNYSGGTIQHTTTPGSAAEISYTAQGQHSLYLGTRYTNNGGQLAVSVDGGAATTVPLAKALEDVLVRVPLGQFTGGAHTVTATHTGTAGTDVYFDFLEIAYPSATLPTFPALPTTTLATDWDTDAVEFGLAPERAAWLIEALGFGGRANHYAGALWFYELVNPGLVYASATVTFSGTPEFGKTTTITLGGTPISHLNLISDTAASMAQCFALLIAAGSSAVWARADGATLTITARALGTSGNGLTVAADTGGSTLLTATVSGNLAGGADGAWLTDLNAAPRINRACRDWTSSFLAALQGYGITPTVSFSMELGNGDDSTATGIAQRYPDGTACYVSTPALQTNFSAASTAFWQRVYADMAAVMSAAGVTPYLQFGEVQWWYFADASGMPFYDAYTAAAFQAQYGTAMQTIATPAADPAQYPQECAFLPGLIGDFCAAVMAYVRQSQPNAEFEVLYPVDTNNTALMETVNFPAAEWTAANLACLKTENFGFTAARNLDEAAAAIALPAAKGFPAAQTGHLVGISDYTTPWVKEWALAMGAGVESAALFALDQFCLIGYGLPLASGTGRALFMGKG